MSKQLQRAISLITLTLTMSFWKAVFLWVLRAVVLLRYRKENLTVNLEEIIFIKRPYHKILYIKNYSLYYRIAVHSCHKWPKNPTFGLSQHKTKLIFRMKIEVLLAKSLGFLIGKCKWVNLAPLWSSCH